MKILTRFALGVFAFVLLGQVSSKAQISAIIGNNFTSSTYGANSDALPPDANGAVGPRHFMEFINGTVAVYTKTNVSRAVQRKTDIKFWSDSQLIISPDSGVTDPRVVYDPASQRWFATMVDFDASTANSGGDPATEANDFLLAVSTTSDPTGAWHGFLFQADPDTGYFADFPTLGMDSNAVYLSGDFFQDSDTPVGPGLLSIPKADLLLATPTIANRTWFGVMDYADRGQVLQPAYCFDGSSSGNIVSLENIGMDSNPYSNVVTFSVLNGGSSSASLTPSTSIGVLPYFVPDNDVLGAPLLTPTQPDNTSALEANDARISAKVYTVNGVIYVVHNTEFNNHIAIRWYRINAATHALLESGTIADPNFDLFFPSIAANSAGAVVICCNGTSYSLGTYISCYAYVGMTVNGITTFNNPLLLQPGSVNYHGDDEVYAEYLGTPPLSRWGDYSATSPDPADPMRFWTIQMYPSDTDVWSTQITEIILQPPQLSIARSGANVLLTWPSWAANYKLQTIANPVPHANWATFTTALATNGNTISALVPVSTTQNFFRLQGP